MRILNYFSLFAITNLTIVSLKSPTMYMKCVPFCNSQISCKKMRTVAVVTNSKKETILQWRPDVLQGWEIWICLVCNFKGKRDSEFPLRMLLDYWMLLDLGGTSGRQGGKRATDLPYLSRDHLEIKTLIHIYTLIYIVTHTTHTHTYTHCVVHTLIHAQFIID